MNDTAYFIRRQEPEDATALHEVYAQPNVIRWTTMMPHPSLNQWKKGGEEPSNMTRLVACVDEHVVGNIVLVLPPSQRRRHTAEVAMAVHDNWQGKGCGYALMSAALDLADNWLNLYRLELQVYTDNERGLRLYERCGFVTEGILKRYAFRDGQYEDAYAMARLRNVT